ncbi:glycosyltransferase [Oribacterium sp. oral taxon 102]|uniref:glycosyltransferase n=1 Tax=Oribacterium sp. oral taxon 102 TaxID=671214 RepID=UPI0015C162F8|nr:glycosyltransferase [Oribacterium sp. oral taxon 102]NWO22201.1 glycosyltransferase [Oribacterium sp. oral taxon 102]
MSPYIKTHSRYAYAELEKIFEDTDILVAPSIWYETFGFTVLEALSYGIPVIISGNVGAKDILVNGAGIIIEDMDASKLAMILQDITVDKLREMNRIIVEKQTIMQVEDMSRQIEINCYGWEK